MTTNSTTTMRRAVLCGAMMLALVLGPANATVALATDENGHNTPGKGGKCDPEDETTLDMIIEVMQSLWLALPM